MNNIIVSTITIIITLLSINNYVFAINKFENKKIYFGLDIGVSKPAKKNFKEIIRNVDHTKTKATVSLKKTTMYTGKIGWDFYPNMSIEFNFDYKPKYCIGVELENLGKGKSKLNAKIYMLNIIYDLVEFNGLVPNFIVGVGVANIKIKPISIDHKKYKINIFKTKETRDNIFAWQVGIGINKYITENSRVDFSTRLQVVNDVKVRYTNLNKNYEWKNGSIVVETTVGYNYYFPI